MEPVYGQGFFTIGKGVIWYTIVFDYIDEEMYYAGLLERGGGKLREELEMLRANMQRLMDEERVIVNGAETRAEVVGAWVEVRGDPRRPSIVFQSRIPYLARMGRNVYENYYEDTVADYPYTVYWSAMDCVEIESVESSGTVEHGRRVTVIRVRQGEEITGYESVVFNITC